MRASWSREAGAPSLPLAGALAAGILAAAILPVPPSRVLGAALVIASAGGGAGRRRRFCRSHRSPRRAVDRERLAFSGAARRRRGVGGRALAASRGGPVPYGRGTAGPLRRRRAR